MLDIHKDQTIYRENPVHYLPKRQSARGRTPTRLKTDQLAIDVQQWVDEQPQSAWEKMLVRNSTKGFISARVLHREVWRWDSEERQAHQWQLLEFKRNVTTTLYPQDGYYFKYDPRFRPLLNPPKPGQSKFDQILEWAKQQVK